MTAPILDLAYYPLHTKLKTQILTKVPTKTSINDLSVQDINLAFDTNLPVSTAAGQWYFYGTLLHLAIFAQNVDAVNQLLNKGADPNLHENSGNFSPPLVQAIEKLNFFRGLSDSSQAEVDKSLQIVNAILDNPKTDVNQEKLSSSQAALFFACTHDANVELVKRLLDRGADMNYQDVYGVGALDRAVQDNAIEITKILLAHPDCEVDIAREDGMTPLLKAVVDGNVDMARLLLQAGANPNAIRTYPVGGRFKITGTPFMLAALSNNSAMQALLLEYGADNNFVDELGYRAIDYQKKTSEVKAKMDEEINADSLRAFITLLWDFQYVRFNDEDYEKFIFLIRNHDSEDVKAFLKYICIHYAFHLYGKAFYEQKLEYFKKIILYINLVLPKINDDDDDKDSFLSEIGILVSPPLSLFNDDTLTLILLYQNLLEKILVKIQDKNNPLYFDILILLIKTLSSITKKQKESKKELYVRLKSYLKEAFQLDEKASVQSDYVLLYIDTVCQIEQEEAEKKPDIYAEISGLFDNCSKANISTAEIKAIRKKIDDLKPKSFAKEPNKKKSMHVEAPQASGDANTASSSTATKAPLSLNQRSKHNADRKYQKELKRRIKEIERQLKRATTPSYHLHTQHSEENVRKIFNINSDIVIKPLHYPGVPFGTYWAAFTVTTYENKKKLDRFKDKFTYSQTISNDKQSGITYNANLGFRIKLKMDERVHAKEYRVSGKGDFPIFLNFNEIKVHKEVECNRNIVFVPNPVSLASRHAPA